MFKQTKIFTLILLLFSYSLVSQEDYKYFGAIKLNDSSLITYKVILKEKDGKITGYSVTDLGGEHETRSNVFGEYNEDEREMSFRETGIVYTKSEVTTYDFCFVNTTFKNFKLGKTKNIKAPFLGLFSDNTECISGELLLTEEEKINKRIEKVAKYIEKSKKISDSVKEKIDPVKMMEQRNNNILKKGQVLNVFSSNSEITLYLYDSGEVDNDKISLKVNSKIILEEFTAEKEKKEITIPLETLVTSIEIKALNEGDLGKNTVRVLIKDSDNQTIRVLTSLNLNDVATVKIHKK